MVNPMAGPGGGGGGAVPGQEELGALGHWCRERCGATYKGIDTDRVGPGRHTGGAPGAIEKG
jgi:hypothetical protein